MLYLDTSVVVTAYTLEPDTSRVIQWLSNAQERLVVSDWVKTEFASAISIRMRSGAMRADHRIVADRAFAHSLQETLRVVGFQHWCFERARQLVSDHRSGLRAGDALHLAIAEDQGAILCTRDRRMAAGAEVAGIRAQLI